MIQLNQSAAALFAAMSDVVMPDIMLSTLCFDSRDVTQNSAFIALGSVTGNRNEYIATALEQGAVLVLFDPADGPAPLDERCLAVVNLKQKTGEFLRDWFGSVMQQLAVIGITGTNGKSSVSFYVAQILTTLQKPTAVMGTLGYGELSALKPTGMTTLPLEKLHGALAELAQHFAAVAMEVSSHGLHQNRLAGVDFKGAVYTNLSHDHLDYHGTLEAYAEAKALLFQRPELAFAVVNGDDDCADQMLANCQAKQVLCYGQAAHNALQFSVTGVAHNGMHLDLSYQGVRRNVTLPLFGEFNAYNAAAALGVALCMGFDFDPAVQALSSLYSVAGRMERVSVRAEQPLVLVDYAHTPDALEQVLNTSRAHCRGKLIVVVGCGGDRDRTKRPVMGEIAARYADVAIITSDNPRSESPASIAEQMTAHLTPSQYQIQLDREQAIRFAIEQAAAEDLVLIAGKGHEDYQEINGQRSYFSDVAVAKAVLEVRP